MQNMQISAESTVESKSNELSLDEMTNVSGGFWGIVTDPTFQTAVASAAGVATGVAIVYVNRK